MVLHCGSFCSPGGQKIYKSITSLEVTFKKVTFKVLMNSCCLGATCTAGRVQSTSALERDRLVFGRSCDHRFKWSVGLHEEDRIMGYTDQYQWVYFSFFQLLLFDFYTRRANICYRHVQTLIISLQFKVLLPLLPLLGPGEIASPFHTVQNQV